MADHHSISRRVPPRPAIGKQMGETAREKRLDRLIRISSSCHL